MDVSTNSSTGEAWDGEAIRLSSIGGAIAVATVSGTVQGATPVARSLMARYAVMPDAIPSTIFARFWHDLTHTPMGEAIIWRPSNDGPFLGCTRYHLGQHHVLLVMREMADRNFGVTHRLHEQRLEATGRLIATIAHDLRTPLASILFNAHFLENYWDKTAPELTIASIQEIRTACDRLRQSIDGLLDFARLGAPLLADIAFQDVFDRVASLLRPALREGIHALELEVHEDTPVVRGNTLILEQILVNLILNAIESARGPIRIFVRTEPCEFATHRGVKIFVEDNGPGIPEELASRIFEPFFTTKPSGTGLGLTTAREAAQQLGGDLFLECSEHGARFVVLLLVSRPPDTQSTGSGGIK